MMRSMVNSSPSAMSGTFSKRTAVGATPLDDLKKRLPEKGTLVVSRADPFCNEGANLGPASSAKWLAGRSSRDQFDWNVV